MFKRIIIWFKQFFGNQPVVHNEKNGLWWQEQGNGTFQVGLQSRVIEELGDITFLDTPRVNEIISKNDQLIDIEGGKAVETFKAPINGTISKVYDEYQKAPNKLSEIGNPVLVEITTTE